MLPFRYAKRGRLRDSLGRLNYCWYTKPDVVDRGFGVLQLVRLMLLAGDPGGSKPNVGVIRSLWILVDPVWKVNTCCRITGFLGISRDFYAYLPFLGLRRGTATTIGTRPLNGPSGYRGRGR